MRAEVLRLVAKLGVAAITHRHEQVALPVEHQPRAEMSGAVDLRLLAEDHLHRFQRAHVVIEPAPRHGGAVAAFSSLREGEIDEPVRREVGIERHVEQPALVAHVDLRHAGDRVGKRARGRDVAQVARPLGHQHVAIGQEGDGPRIEQPVGESLDMDFAGLGGEGPVHGLRAARGEKEDRRRRRDEHCGAQHGLSFRDCRTGSVVRPWRRQSGIHEFVRLMHSSLMRRRPAPLFTSVGEFHITTTGSGCGLTWV
jgi:hypothetical protein